MKIFWNTWKSKCLCYHLIIPFGIEVFYPGFLHGHSSVASYFLSAKLSFNANCILGITGCLAFHLIWPSNLHFYVRYILTRLFVIYRIFFWIVHLYPQVKIYFCLAFVPISYFSPYIHLLNSRSYLEMFTIFYLSLILASLLNFIL